MAERWSPKECHQYFESRAWEWVLGFYELLVKGEASLLDLRIVHSDEDSQHFVEEDSCADSPVMVENSSRSKGPKWDRRTFKLVVCYSGTAFAGWQRQPGFLTVQSVLEKALGRFVDGKRAKLLEEQGKIKEALVSVAGRTDKGVHAAGQVCSFYTWMKDCKAEEVEAVVNSAMPMALRAVTASEVDRGFHPVFSARWRRYVYILPVNSREEIDVQKVTKMLQALEGLHLSYAIFARDTKSGRSSGPATFCTVYHARAAIAELPYPDTKRVLDAPNSEARLAMVVELVADRFLRKMVRVLVSTAVREAAAGASFDALLSLTENSSRKASAPPAPAQGLCLVEVGYEKLQKSGLLLRI